ncbi:8392_t:CDS:1, partial [Acaulospora morrowiae]
KAAADSEFSIVGVTNSVASSIMPNNNNQGTLDGGEKGGSTMELTSSENSHDSMSVDDAKIHTPTNKGTGANIDVPNVGCKAEPSSKENAESTDGNKIGKSNSSKSPSSTSSSQTPQPQTTTNNKKRTRATPEQLAILEDTFKTNTSPNSKVREALAEKVNMSERSIQIWFQNRRAKMKAMQKRAHLMINQDAMGHFMTCMPNYGPYPFRMPIHPQRIPLPRSYSASDLTPTLNNVALAGMRPQPNSGLGITVPQVPQGFWPSGPLTAPITSLGGGDSSHLMNGFPFSANPIVNPQQQAPRFPISPNA